MRHINAAGLAILKESESLRLHAYRCPAGILTIGWGHTGPDVHEGLTISAERAEELLQADLAAFEAGVEKALGQTPATDNQFSAMVSLAYNIGLGAFKTTSVLAHHKEGRHGQAALAFLLWNKSKGKVLPGLTTRRDKERSLYLRGLK